MRDNILGFSNDIESFNSNSDFVAMLCGSSLIMNNPNDTDIFIYCMENEKDFANDLFLFLKNIDENARISYNTDFIFYSVKYKSVSVNYSLHIVSVKTIETMIDAVNESATYTDVNIFEVKLYMQSVYRKWIIETEYICGSDTMMNTVKNHLLKTQNTVDSKAVLTILKNRIANNIYYFKEKHKENDVVSNVIIMQIVNNLVNYCYFINNKYYGTVKYIQTDLISFSVDKQICELTLELLQSINIKSNDFFIKKLEWLEKEIC